MASTVGIRFKQAGKLFYYDAGDLEVQIGTYVVVETSHGLAVGRVVITPDQVIANELREEVKPVLRLASQDDIEAMESLQEKAKNEADLARKKVAELDLAMTIVGGEYDLAGELLTLFFTAPERVDFRALVREVGQATGTRVQMLQVGDRDRAKIVDGFDICGERLCCSSWMTNFPSVSIRMAKEQDLPLNPQKISGVCGRLYCCLTFEYEDYKALRGTLPKVGSFLSTPAGEAKLVSIDFVREKVWLQLTDSRTRFEMAAVDLKLQHGVTVRPMELVRQIEGPMRSVREDSRGRRRPGRTERARMEPVMASRPDETSGPTPQDGEASASGDANRRRRRRRGRGGRGRGNSSGPGEQPGSS